MKAITRVQEDPLTLESQDITIIAVTAADGPRKQGILILQKATVLNTGMYVHDTRNSGKESSVSIVTRIRLDVWASIPARDTMSLGLLICGWRYGEFHYNLRIGRSRAFKSIKTCRHIAG